MNDLPSYMPPLTTTMLEADEFHFLAVTYSEIRNIIQLFINTSSFKQGTRENKLSMVVIVTATVRF